MKKLLSAIVCLLLLCSIALPVTAAGEPPQITLQPQNYQYPEYSVAIYTVKATGTNLSATWYLKFEGKTYNISDLANGIEPWEGYAGENYGYSTPDDNTFIWVFGGIGKELSGAEIWCVIEDGHYDVTSDRAVITVQGEKMPPEILQVPAGLTVKRGEEAEIRCVSKSASEAQLAFQWYETPTGKLQDIRAIDGEDSDYLFCNTEKTGTRYYVCGVTSTEGGRVYSSVIPVTIENGDPTPAGKAPAFLTKTLPQGVVGEDYGFILETDDHGATFSVAYNAGGANDFEKTGLKLSMEGMLMGKLTKAGTYTFTVCVSNAYGVLTLKVTDPSGTTPPAASEETQATPSGTAPETSPDTTLDTTPATSPDTTPDTTPATTPDTAPVATQPQTQAPDQPHDSAPFPWRGYLLIVLGGVGIGIGISIAFMSITKKKNS